MIRYALYLLALLLLVAPIRAQDEADEAPTTQPPSREATLLSPLQLTALQNDLRHRQSELSSRAVAYLWDQRLSAESGKIGHVQPRFLQALTILALAADGKLEHPAYRDRLMTLLADFMQPLDRLDLDAPPQKLYIGTSHDVLAFETHAVIALAFQQLAIADLGDPRLNERLQLGAASAIAYILDYRKRGRTYDSAGGWPVNAMAYNRNRPDRRCTAWLLTLLKAHGYSGADVDATALTEAPNFILAAQRLVPPMNADLEAARQTYEEWAPAMRRGEALTGETRDAVNRWLEYERQRAESGGFGLDTLGIVIPSATAVGLWTLGVFEPESSSRYRAAVEAFQRMPLNWDAQRFFLTQFFAVRGLLLYSRHYDQPDYWLYMNRLVTLMEQQQNADGSFPLGSRGVEELTQMELVYTTAMSVLILNPDRAALLFDRAPY